MTFSSEQQATRRQALRFVTLCGASLAIAACTAKPGPLVQQKPIDTVTRPMTPSQVEQRHLVAVIVPLTGPDAGVGTSLSNAANLALLDSGETNIRLSVYDSAGPGGAAAATRNALQDGAGLILGPLLAENVTQTLPLARAAKVPVISFSNDERVAGNGAYIMGLTPRQSIDRTMAYLKGQGVTDVAGMTPTGIYGARAAQSLIDASREAQVSVTAMESYDRSAESVTSAAGRLSAKGGYQAVLIGDSGRIAAFAAPKLSSARLFGTELWSTDKELGQTPALRGAVYSTVSDAYFNQLVGHYRQRYDKSPFRLASLGYDAVLLAVRAAKDWPIGTPFPQAVLLDADGFGGVDGSFRFKRSGVAERLLEVREVTAGGTKVVAPAKTAF